MEKSEVNNDQRELPITDKPYKSCIKIHGLRILPPILTEEKRVRMQYYRQLAVKVEEKIKSKNFEQIFSDSGDDCQSATYINSNSSSLNNSTSTSDEESTYTSQIFNKSSLSDVLKMLKDSPKANNNSESAISNVPLKNSDTNKCLLTNKDLPTKMKSLINRNVTPTKPNLCIDILEKSKEDGLKIFSDNDKSSNFCNQNNLSHQGAGDNVTNTNSNQSKNEEIPPPVLIRSNSYVLDTPSPMLLALIKQNTNNDSKISDTSSDSGNRKRRTWDLENAKEKWSSIEHDLNIVADKINFGGFNSLPQSTVSSPEKKLFDSKIERDLNFPEKELEVLTPEHQQKPKQNDRFVKAVVTPVRSCRLDKINSKQCTSLKKINLNQKIVQSEIILPEKPDILSCEKSEKQIRELIEKIHNEQSKQMSDLIARQKKEQQNLIKFFAEQQTFLLSKLRNDKMEEIIKDEKLENPEDDIIKSSDSVLFECKKILLEETTIYTPDVSSQTIYLSSPEDTINDVTLKSCSPSPKENICPSSSSTKFTPDSLNATNNNNTSKSFLKTKITRSCSKQLFPIKKQVWAATIINAVARGYLVRRLIKTERVQNLIKTIRDTLVCAMELHHETTDNIQPSDVELHRRLIQQVTAACFSFHDIFFELSRSEQLSIIALDRIRQKEKLSRPVSARSNVSLTSTTQKFLERKLKRRSSDSLSRPQSRCSSSRSCHSSGEFRIRTKSLGLNDSTQSSRKTSPQNDVMRRTISFGANKKPWR